MNLKIKQPELTRCGKQTLRTLKSSDGVGTIFQRYWMITADILFAGNFAAV